MLVAGDQALIAILVMIFETIATILASVSIIQAISKDLHIKLWKYLFDRSVKPEDIERVPYDKFASAEDEFVKSERAYVADKRYPKDVPIVVDAISKQFGKFVAVDRVSITIEKGTVFGLLGPNGAGKSTLISMLTGMDSPTSGKALIGGFDIRKDPENAFKLIGVCPQFDTLWDDLTVSEHFLFYARLKSVPRELEISALNSALHLVDLHSCADKLVKVLSGGQKRRVSIGIALVSNPKAVFLDEPTTGLDPEVRRKVWDTIARARTGRAILLVSFKEFILDNSCNGRS